MTVDNESKSTELDSPLEVTTDYFFGGIPEVTIGQILHLYCIIRKKPILFEFIMIELIIYNSIDTKSTVSNVN